MSGSSAFFAVEALCPAQKLTLGDWLCERETSGEPTKACKRSPLHRHASPLHLHAHAHCVPSFLSRPTRTSWLSLKLITNTYKDAIQEVVVSLPEIMYLVGQMPILGIVMVVVEGNLLTKLFSAVDVGVGACFAYFSHQKSQKTDRRREGSTALSLTPQNFIRF